jgi:hypothetical protein
MQIGSISESLISKALILAPFLFLAFPLGFAMAAEQASTVDRRERFSFSIAAQPLVSALDAYSSATGIEVLYDSGLADHRHSSEVSGIFTAEIALALLLKGSGLVARRISSGAITIAAMVPGPRPETSAYGSYFGMIQQSFESAFCQVADLGPADYRIILKFKIGPSGEILQLELLGSTGNSRRDQAITEALLRLTLNKPPPTDLPQPVMMLILPQSSGTRLNCSSSN